MLTHSPEDARIMRLILALAISALIMFHVGPVWAQQWQELPNADGSARIVELENATSLPMAPMPVHDEWADGRQVDPQTKDLCCSGADTKIADDIVKSAEGGVSFTDRPGEVIPFSRVQPSPDGHWWRSVWGGQIRCVFGPFSY